ncbi:NADH dehydrogenase [ubiquinone] 1 subunit C2 [Conger conger]|uniref:NADH dehydrogenase [ubiquinone] 1 subunit C2 n=1 Tax=Conger conger TaxID=82655 RepID=UPI002A59C4EC|nr:NADH dehydrogenase [ubiquinone] 1 subunit C2 [Conger conger]
MGLTLPDEAKVLPPPGIINRNSVWLGLCGWTAAMISNALHRRPALMSGVHRQFLYITTAWVLGYHFTKLENYNYAQADREMNEYIRAHPERFQGQGKKTFAEVLEDFHPVR